MGHAPVSFFSPHQAGMKVILDEVFNRTAAGAHQGPTLSFRGLDKSIHCNLEQDRSTYSNYTGCGNTLNVNNPIVRRLIVDT
jgi:glycogen operon protein